MEAGTARWGGAHIMDPSETPLNRGGHCPLGRSPIIDHREAIPLDGDTKKRQGIIPAALSVLDLP